MSDENKNDALTGRSGPLSVSKTAMLVIDVQEYIAVPGKGEYSDIDPNDIPEHLTYFFDRIENNVIANTAKLQRACRDAGIEVLFTVVENLTKDGRDRSLDYKISQINVPKGSSGAKVPKAIAPINDEIVFPKTTSSVFNSTMIDYVLRNLGVEQLIVTGLLTDQCVESSVRDACDKGYIVKLAADACGTYSQERHDNAISAYSGYCHVTDTATVLNMIKEAQ
ncbi:MAG: isochorismatase family cysteine hydrolase [Psychrobium sp.]